MSRFCRWSKETQAPQRLLWWPALALWLGLCHPALAFEVFEGFQVHGFLSQGYILTTNNNFFGSSERGGSLDFTEIGVNASWTPLPRLQFAVQPLFRRAGAGHEHDVELDFGLMDYVIFDTIDFLDLVAIVALHDECRRQKKPAITAWGVGWGAVCLYFPVGGTYSVRRLFGLREDGPVENESYVAALTPLVKRLEGRLEPDVIKVSKQALTVMEDGTPCPASQVSPGAFAVGALGGTLAVRIVAGLPILPAPHLLLADMPSALTREGIDLSK